MPTFGILHDFRRPSGRGYATYYAECLEEVAEADRLGFQTVWLSEHHHTPDGMVSAPLVLAAAVDLLSGGRLVLGVGQGYAPREFAAFGVPRRERATRLEESLAIVRQALGTGRVSVTGRHWTYDDVPVTPSPHRPVPVHVGG